MSVFVISSTWFCFLTAESVDDVLMPRTFLGVGVLVIFGVGVGLVVGVGFTVGVAVGVGVITATIELTSPGVGSVVFCQLPKASIANEIPLVEAGYK